MSVDATQIEINPFVETADGDVYCVDAKLTFDDCAAYRQQRIFAMDDNIDADARELLAAKHDLNYVPLDGTIGCLVNGAGLAMATMDAVKMHGAEPANFLDVGGRVDEQAVLKAFEIITADQPCGKKSVSRTDKVINLQNVRVILVNIFGGIVNCDLIAKGLVDASQSLHLTVPVIVRLEGTNADAARERLARSGLAIITATDLDDAAEKAVRAIRDQC